MFSSALGRFKTDHVKGIQRLIPTYYSDPSWREVFLLTAEMLDDADGFFDLFSHQLNGLALKRTRLNAFLMKGNSLSLDQRKISSFLILDTALARALARYFKSALEISQEKGFEDCHQALLRLALPEEDASRETCQKFAGALLDIFKATFNIEEYEFTVEEAEEVAEYLQATKLLLDCLKVAYVSDRAAIEDRLLRPEKITSE